MSKQIYQLTNSDLKKCTINKDEIPAKLEQFDAENKVKLGKKFALKKRDYASQLMILTQGYKQGCWQGRLDKYNGEEYTKTDDECYNLGYYRGFNENVNGWIADAKKSNPNFQ
jgi:hypothetical protein